MDQNRNASSPPGWGHPALTRFGRWCLDRWRWTVSSGFPPLAKSVVIVVPHTSNLDFFVGLFTAWSVDLKPTFVGKHTLFRWPLGPIMRGLGGIPVNRRKTAGFVERTASLVASAERIALVIAPEGTRKSVERWKTGFYHIAVAAGVPIVPAYIDWKTRTVGFGPPYSPTGDRDTDIDALMDFYARFSGRR